MNIVLFLGAGFSAPFGMPTMNQFSEELAKSKKISDRERSLYNHLKLDVQKANSFLDSPSNNLEAILSFFSMGNRLENPDGFLSVPYTEVVSILKKVYSHIKRPDNYWDELDQFKRFLQIDINTYLREGHNIQIITTNYDLIIESILFSQQVYAEFPFEYDTTSQGKALSLYQSNAVPLYKLHGSINWFNSGNKKIILEDRVIEDPENRNNMMPASYTNSSYVGSPIIIPPTYTKPELPNQLRRVWTGASEAIQNAEKLIFIGYSFPETDTEMKYFFARSLRDNAILQEIKVYDERANEIVKALKDVNSGYGKYFKSLLKPIDGNWVKQRIGISRNDSGELEFA